MGYRADTCYCIALCHYMMKQYAAALKYITEIIERGIKEHPGTISSNCEYYVRTGVDAILIIVINLIMHMKFFQ